MSSTHVPPTHEHWHVNPLLWETVMVVLAAVVIAFGAWALVQVLLNLSF